MANDSINDQVMDSVKNLQDLVIGAVLPSIAMLNNVMAETIGMSMHNAVTAQHNAQMLNAATTTSTCAKILAVIASATPPPVAPVVVPPVIVVAPTDPASNPTEDVSHEVVRSDTANPHQ